PELAELVIHVEICLQCQNELESLTCGNGWKTTVPDPTVDRRPGDETAARSAISTATEPPDQFVFGFKLCPASEESDPAGEQTAAVDTDLDADFPIGVSTPVPSLRRAWPQVPGYEITRRLGKGGMGVVYEARQLGLNRRVALKMIRGGAQAQPDLVARF